eukprot:Lithocolla_globosa_v1_NODE_1287_length_2699_cov_5.975794.p2 type:complete len:187 gc:universal NODE_1287_length_2699_cov_5.975794:2312-1752(-)
MSVLGVSSSLLGSQASVHGFSSQQAGRHQPYFEESKHHTKFMVYVSGSQLWSASLLNHPLSLCGTGKRQLFFIHWSKNLNVKLIIRRNAICFYLLNTGKILRLFRDLLLASLTPALYNHLIYVGDDDGMTVIHQQSGKLVKRLKLNGMHRSYIRSIVAGGDYLCAGTQNRVWIFLVGSCARSLQGF